MSLHPSITSRCSTKTAIVDLKNNAARQPRDSSFMTQNICTKFRWDHPHVGVKCRWVGKNLVFLTDREVSGSDALSPVHTSNNVEATFDFVAMPTTATMSNEFCVEISSFRQSRTLLRQCCPKRQHCRSNRQQSCLLLRQCCFDIVASVDRALPPKICVHPQRRSASTTVRWRRNTRCHQHVWW